MSEINRLTAIATITGAEMIPAYSTALGTAGKFTVTSLLAYFEDTFTAPDFVEAIYVAVTGQTIALTDSSTNKWLILRPAGTIATLTVTLPAVANLVDGQEIMFSSTQTVTTLTISANGATAVVGDPTTIGATSPFKLRYNLTGTSWYLV